MIEFKQVKFRNFLSYGKPFTTFNFDKGITRIGGVNGRGKSAIVDAIHYSLFGKPFRKINLPKLVNSVLRKDLLVEIRFSINDISFKVRRGIKPDIFEIYKNGELIDQEASKKGYQQLLEEDILQFNEDIFHQIGLKSLTRYESFLTLPKAKKRSIIENIFGIEVLSEMKELNRIHIDRLDTKVYDLNKEKTKFELLVDQELKNIEQLKAIQEQLNEDTKESNRKKKEQIVNHQTEMNKYIRGLKIIEEKQTSYKQLNEETSVGDAEKQKTVPEFIYLRDTIEQFDKNIQFVKENCGDCPNICTLEKNDEIDDQRERLAEIEQEREIWYEKREKLQSQVHDMIHNFIDKKPAVVAKIREHKNIIKNIQDSIEPIKSVVDIDYTRYEKLETDIEEVREALLKTDEELKYYHSTQWMLQDDGIKAHIIKQYLPLINKLMNTYLQKFSLNLELEFTSDLSLDIKTKFKETYAYESFSEGEKKRINLSLMFTFLEFCKMKHSHAAIDFLVLDEFSSGLDPEGENTLYDILKDMVDKEGKEIITISHSAMIDPEKISKLYTVDIEHGFSKLLVEEYK